MLKARDLKFRVQLQAPSITYSDDRQPQQSYTTYDTRWAKVEPVSSQEKEQGEGLTAQATLKITMRMFQGLEHDHRLVVTLFGVERNLNVVSIVPNDVEDSITIMVMDQPEEAGG